MLNYKELDLMFDQILAGFSKQDLENWLAFDAEREMLERLQEGQTVITHHKVQVARPKTMNARDSFLIESVVEFSYALAA